MSTQRVLIIALLIAVWSVPTLEAQGPLTSDVWVAPALAFGSSSLFVYNDSGALVATFPWAAFGALTIAKALDGRVWVSETGSGRLWEFSQSGGAISFVPVAGITGVAVDVSGDLWTQSGGLFSAAIIRRHDSFGQIVSSFASTLSLPGNLATDPFGNLWVSDALAVQVEKFDPFGNSSGVIPLVAVYPPSSLVVDRAGRPWLLSRPTSSAMSGAKLLRLTTNGVQDLALNLPGAVALTLDAGSRPRVLVHGPGGVQRVLTLDPTTGATLGSVTLPAGTPLDGLAVGLNGTIFCSSETSGELLILDREGVLVGSSTVPTGLSRLDLGDTTGSRLLGVLHGSLDPDGDLVSTKDEVAYGTNPVDSTSFPLSLSTLQAPVAGQNVTLSLSFPGEGGCPFFTGASFTAGSFALSDISPLRAPLAVDSLLVNWISPTNPILSPGSFGVLNAIGSATLLLTLPAGTAGVTFRVAALTVSVPPVRVQSVTFPLELRIQ